MLRLFLPLLFAVLSCGFIALPIEDAANTSRTDAQAADGKGGWLDMGSHDLRDLPAGEAKYADVKFVVPPSGDENAKNCIVLGRSGPESATLSLQPSQTLQASKLPNAQTSQHLYLLHAIAEGFVLGSQRAIGKIVLRYDDGTHSEREIMAARDVTDWTGGHSFENAVRAWTEYNNNTQVSLVVSKFKLDEKKKLVEITFSATGRRPWMIVAATVDKDRKLHPIRSSVEPTGTYKSPEPPPAGLARFPGKKPKNVILIIGDGMGQGAARLASYFKYGHEDGAYFQQLPAVGLCTTFSASAPVTDSAASATAFATGTKTSNGVLGLRVDEKHTRTNAVMLTSVAARASAQGRGVAILSTDPLFGATPAAFFAHSPSRGDSELICAQAAECGYDVLVGASTTEPWLLPEAKNGKRKDGRDLVAEMEKKGYSFARTTADVVRAPKDSKILGMLTSFGVESKIDEAAVGEAMAAVLGRVAERPAGFFMMAECGATDHACHRNDPSFVVKTVSMVEFMAKTAVDFARARGDTLVVVTADHDTGHPMVVRGVGPDGRLVIQWTTTSHTAFPVPLYAYGPGAELFEGLIDNTDIAKNIACLLDLAE